MKIEEWPLDKFIEYINNPRKNDHAVDIIASAIHIETGKTYEEMKGDRL